MSANAPESARTSLFTSPKTVLKYAALLIACALPFLSSGERAFDELVRDGQLYLDPGSLTPFTGVAVATYAGESSRIAQHLGISGDHYEGPFERLTEDRRLSSKESYEDGIRHGPYEWYFESGEVFEEGTYVDGWLEGPYRAYWETGDLYEEGTYRRGQFDGPRRWFMDGRLVEIVTYRNGIIEGIYERYSPDGELSMKGMLFDGDPCGRWIEGAQVINYATCGARVTE